MLWYSPRVNAPLSLKESIYRTRPDQPWRYSDLDRLQREIATGLRENEGASGAVVFSEVAPVITFGQRAKTEEELRFAPEFFKERGIELTPTDRGGLATYHGPGQWVVFVVERLDRLTGDAKGVRKAVCGLLQAACATARRFDVPAEVREGRELGVWTPKGKLAAVGVRVREGILQHGLALNVFPTEHSFLGLRPCGLEAAVDFLYESGHEERFLATREALSEELKRVFSCEFVSG